MTWSTTDGPAVLSLFSQFSQWLYNYIVDTVGVLLSSESLLKKHHYLLLREIPWIVTHQYWAPANLELYTYKIYKHCYISYQSSFPEIFFQFGSSLFGHPTPSKRLANKRLKSLQCEAVGRQQWMNQIWNVNRFVKDLIPSHQERSTA